MERPTTTPLMKFLPYIATLILGLILFFWVKGVYNSMVAQEEDVKAAWSQVENQYQRRADLIPNLVNTVKGYALHERETLTSVINARARAMAVTVDPSRLDDASLDSFQAAQSALGTSLSRLLALMESYPALKASERFGELQAQLEGTENRIAVERKRFNETAQKYNKRIRSFPDTLLAGVFGFEPKAYFKADSDAGTAPSVNFSENGR